MSGGVVGDVEEEEEEVLYEIESLPEPRIKHNIFRNKHLLNRSQPWLRTSDLGFPDECLMLAGR